MFPVLEEAPRYLHWLSSQGLLGTIHPWCAIVAADLGRRIRWRRCAPTRGAGRLLWMCEQMAPPTQVADVVPDLWLAATGRQHFSPDWSGVGRPANCHLDGPSYRSLLLERTTGYTLEATLEQVKATGPAGAVLATWTGPQYRVTPVQRGEANAGYPEGDGWRGAALFTWRGDYRGTSWLAQYSGFVPVR
jgi:helicase